jgi:predicted nucleic acid-binding Zn ribbon protein
MHPMATHYSCFKCHIVVPLLDGAKEQCPRCGGTNGEVLSQERVSEGFKAGTYFNIDSKTGGPAKEKPRGKR